MDVPKGFFNYVYYFLIFLPVFVFLFLIGFVKGAIFSPFVFLVIAFGDTGIVLGLWPFHIVWSIYCLIKTKKFGPFMKCLLILLVPIPIALWTVIGVVGSAVMGVVYGYIWPVMETFKAISRDSPIHVKLARCVTDGTWSCILGACTIVRDFGDFSFHSYFSVMEGLLQAEDGEEPIELKIGMLPGCIVSAILGVLVDLPIISLITLCKSPIMLFKGWKQLLQDLIGREGPFLETVCVPFAGLWILLWPVVVLLATLAGLLSSFGFGIYAAVVAYQENSTKKGMLYVIASASVFDEYTNDFLYLQEGSCFPRPRYRKREVSGSSLLPVNGGQGLDIACITSRTSDPSCKLKVALIWDSFFKAYEDIGKELIHEGAIGISDLEAWHNSKSKIINIGIPAYAFLECLFRSIKCKSNGLVLRNNVEVTSVNRPEGCFFDWLYEPMFIMKEQIRSLNLDETQELYLYKLCLYNGDTERIESWPNGGSPPVDMIKRAQLEGISRRLQGFCLTLSRLPTTRRRFSEVVEEIEKESNKMCRGFEGGEDDLEANGGSSLNLHHSI